MYQLQLLLTSHKSLQGNLQDTHKFEFTVQMQIPKCVSTLNWSKYESHTATND